MSFADRPACVLVGVQLPGVGDDEHESSLDELERLAVTLGARVVGRVTQRRDSLSHGAVLGSGKLVELARRTGGTGVIPSVDGVGDTEATLRFESQGCPRGL